MPISSTLKSALDKSAKDAWKKEKEGDDSPPLSSAAKRAQSAPASGPMAVAHEPPQAGLLSPPYPEVTVTFDPSGHKINMKNWKQLTPRMIEAAFRPQLKELLRLRAIQSREDTKGE